MVSKASKSSWHVLHAVLILYLSFIELYSFMCECFLGTHWHARQCPRWWGKDSKNDINNKSNVSNHLCLSGVYIPMGIRVGEGRQISYIYNLSDIDMHSWENTAERKVFWYSVCTCVSRIVFASLPIERHGNENLGNQG